MLACPSCRADLSARADEWTDPGWLAPCPNCEVDLVVSGMARAKLLVAYLVAVLLSFAAGDFAAYAAKLLSDGRVLLVPRDISLLLMIVSVSVLALRTRWFLERWGELKLHDSARSLQVASRVVTGLLLAILAGLVAFLLWR